MLRRLIGDDGFLVARFAVATLLAFVAVGVVSGWVVERQVRVDAERFATFHAAFVRDAVLLPELEDAGVLDPMVDEGTPVGGADLQAILPAIRERVLDDTVRRVRVWSPDGVLLLSDDGALIGRSFPDFVDRLATGADEPTSYVSDLSSAGMARHVGLVDKAFVTLLPLTRGTVLEVVQDYAPTQAAIDRFTDRLSLTRIGGLGLAFLLVLPIAYTASRRLRRQSTDLERKTEELSRLLEVEQETAQRLREVDRMKNTFLTAVSHEVRTPLTVVQGMSSTLRRQGSALSPERRAQLLERLETNAARLDTLLADLLDIDHLTRGVVSPRRGPTNVRALVERAVSHVDPGSHTITADVPAVVADVDANQVERIVENLVANAVRHTPPGCRVEVGVRSLADGLELVVADDGPGVSPHLRNAIFEPFAQGEIHDDHSPGTGIGLSLVARFAELHGGRAWVEPAPSGGAAFHVILRAEVAPSGLSGDPDPAAFGGLPVGR